MGVMCLGTKYSFRMPNFCALIPESVSMMWAGPMPLSVNE